MHLHPHPSTLACRNDLRLHDNYMVAEAVKRVRMGEYAEVSIVLH